MKYYLLLIFCAMCLSMSGQNNPTIMGYTNITYMDGELFVVIPDYGIVNYSIGSSGKPVVRGTLAVPGVQEICAYEGFLFFNTFQYLVVVAVQDFINPEEIDLIDLQDGLPKTLKNNVFSGYAKKSTAYQGPIKFYPNTSWPENAFKKKNVILKPQSKPLTTKTGSMSAMTAANGFLYIVNPSKLMVYDINKSIQNRKWFPCPVNISAEDFDTLNKFETVYIDRLFAPQKLLIGGTNGVTSYLLEVPSNPNSPAFVDHIDEGCDPPISVDGYIYISLRKGVECPRATENLITVWTNSNFENRGRGSNTNSNDSFRPECEMGKNGSSIQLMSPHGIAIAEESDLLWVCDGNSSYNINNCGIKLIEFKKGARNNPLLRTNKGSSDLSGFYAYDILILSIEINEEIKLVAIVTCNDGIRVYENITDYKKVKMLAHIPIK